MVAREARLICCCKNSQEPYGTLKVNIFNASENYYSFNQMHDNKPISCLMKWIGVLGNLWHNQLITLTLIYQWGLQ